MKVGTLVRHINNKYVGDIGIIVELSLWDVYKVLWPDGSISAHYPHNLKVINESR